MLFGLGFNFNFEEEGLPLFLIGPKLKMVILHRLFLFFFWGRVRGAWPPWAPTGSALG